MNKKGDITDIIIFMLVIFILGIGLFIFAYIVPQISNGLLTAGMNDTSEGANAINHLSDFGTVTLQRGFFLLFMGLIASMMVTSFFARVHPIFLFLYIIVLGLTIFLSVYIGNVYQDIVSNALFTDTLASQGLINIVMNNIITIVLAVGALSMIIIFAKFSSGGVEKI